MRKMKTKSGKMWKVGGDVLIRVELEGRACGC